MRRALLSAASATGGHPPRCRQNLCSNLVIRVCARLFKGGLPCLHIVPQVSFRVAWPQGTPRLPAVVRCNFYYCTILITAVKLHRFFYSRVFQWEVPSGCSSTIGACSAEQVLTTGDTPELQLQHAREGSRSSSPAARGFAVGPPPQEAAKAAPAVQPKKSRSGKRKPKGAVPALVPAPKPAGRRPAARKRGRSSTPDYGFDTVRSSPPPGQFFHYPRLECRSR